MRSLTTHAKSLFSPVLPPFRTAFTLFAPLDASLHRQKGAVAVGIPQFGLYNLIQRHTVHPRVTLLVPALACRLYQHIPLPFLVVPKFHSVQHMRIIFAHTPICSLCAFVLCMGVNLRLTYGVVGTPVTQIHPFACVSLFQAPLESISVFWTVRDV